MFKPVGADRDTFNFVLSSIHFEKTVPIQVFCEVEQESLTFPLIALHLGCVEGNSNDLPSRSARFKSVSPSL